MSLKQQFARARQHIDDGDYDKARKVLTQIDHPKATEWIMKIDRISPRAKVSLPLWPWLVGVAVIVVLGIGAVLFIQDQNAIREAGQANAEQTRSEREAYVEMTMAFQDALDIEQVVAGEMADQLIDAFSADVVICTTVYDYDVQPTRFMECLTPYVEHLVEMQNAPG